MPIGAHDAREPAKEPLAITDGPLVGQLHLPEGTPRAGLALTHGAGTSSDAAVLRAVAEELAQRGIAVLRYDLPFRLRSPSAPPHPSRAAEDRAGIAAAAAWLRARVEGPLVIGGHSYGGRQSTLLAAEQPELADGLLLLSYPLHPPGKPERPRTEHLPNLRAPALAVHGSRDPFGTIADLSAALALVPARTSLRVIDRAGHDLSARADEVAAAVNDGVATLWDAELRGA